MAMSLGDLESLVRGLMADMGEILKRVRHSANISKAEVISVNEKTMCHCDVRLLDTSKVIQNIPIAIPYWERCSGKQPDKGTIVFVEHQGEGMLAKIINIAEISENELIAEQKGEGSASSKASICKS